MGFLDNVGKVLGIVADTAGKVAERERKKQSAINRGRMRKTDQIKGSSSNIPQEPGMYRHVNKQTGEIDYVGQTDNLRVRQQQHARDGKLNTSTHDVHYSVARNSATKDDLCETEKDISKEINHLETKPKAVMGKGKI